MISVQQEHFLANEENKSKFKNMISQKIGEWLKVMSILPLCDAVLTKQHLRIT